MVDLLVEIGTEEIPAGYMRPALDAVQKLARGIMAENHIGHGEVLTTGTPRRIVLLVRDVNEVQDKQSREVMGPSKKTAFNEDGTPTRACEGFARAQGVEPGSLKVKETPKGDYVFAVREEGGCPTTEIMPEVVPAIISGIPFPKSMRWGNGSVRFSRPIRWILAIIDGQVIPFDYDGITSSNISRGHRFMGPGSFTVSDPENFFRRAKGAMVIVDHCQRQKIIHKSLAEAAEAQNAVVLEDAELLETVNFLVEYPTITCGGFNEEYLKLPPEVLITSMKSHQKYFPVVDKKGNLKPLFLTVNNIKAKDMDVIRRGNERVLSARLADARFFYQEDLKDSLADKVEKLKKVVYQEKLGTSYEKMVRFRGLASYLSRKYVLGDPDVIERAASLCKADLVSEMVGEFPDLQGIMGKYYAIESGEKEEVAEAIFEHYLPRFAGDEIPSTMSGAVVSIADKIDTITGSFAIGHKPTGSEDPYGLRRLTLGIINIMFNKGLEIDLPDLINKSLMELEDKIEQPAGDIARDVLDFFRGRLQNLLVQEDHRYDIVEAVLSSGMANLPDVRLRLKALDDFRKKDEFEPLTIAFKRVVNIIPDGFRGKADPDILKEKAEKELFGIFKDKEKGILKLKSERKYGDVLKELASIRPAVDKFFDEVMVMVEDDGVKNNRLSLMSNLAGLFAEVADFSKIVI